MILPNISSKMGSFFCGARKKRIENGGLDAIKRLQRHGGGVGDAKSSFSSEGAVKGLTLAGDGDPTSQSWFEQHDGPTLLVAAAIYASWLALLASHRYVPWWITAPLAGYVVQWHSSLQHEAIHSMRGIPKWLRRALVWPPIGVWFPFELYRRLHSQHHRNRHLTYPGEDRESYYHKKEDWERYGILWRWLLIVNQTVNRRAKLTPDRRPMLTPLSREVFGL